jgi:hypothetical protein
MGPTLQLIGGVLLIGTAIVGIPTARRMEPNPALWRLHYGLFAAYGGLLILHTLVGDSPYELVLVVSQIALVLLVVWNLFRIFRAARAQGKARHQT